MTDDAPIDLAAKRPRAAKCPICGRPSTPDAKPFCSTRCREVDLARWFNEVYRVPVEADGDEDEEAVAAGRGEEG
jgi:endogenous inhibitor of DNA gyrase (YacG/DUF329 family)